MPWATPETASCVPGKIALKVTLGEAPEHIPAVADIRRGLRSAAQKLDGGPIDRVLNHFSDRCQIARVHNAAASLSGPKKRHEPFDDLEHATGLSRTFQVEIDQHSSITDIIDALRQVAIVEEASPYYLCSLPFAPAAAVQPETAFDPGQAWKTRDQINARQALAYEPGDPAIIVAIVDTGVLLEHRELHSRLRPGFNTVDFDLPDLAAGIRLVGHWTGPDNDPEDFVGHGTSCAGIVGAVGEEIPPGLAGKCQMLPIRVLAAAVVPGKEDPVGLGAIYDIDRGLKRAIDLGAKVLNMSFGTPESSLQAGDPKPHSDVVRYGLARGCVPVAASGNNGKSERFLPAGLDGVVAVSSVGHDDMPSKFSTLGEHVALAAPGESVVSSGLHGYQRASGTSFASPFVAAASALLVSRAERRAESINARDVARILRKSARPFPRQAKADGAGAGVLDAVAALKALDNELDQRASGQDAGDGGL